MEKKIFNGKRKLLIALVLLILLVGGGCIAALQKATTILESTEGISDSKLNKSLVSTENDIKTYGVYIILNQMSTRQNVNIGGSTVKISSENSDLSFSYFDPYTDAQINSDDDGNIEIPLDGLKLRVDGIKEGNKYPVKIESISSSKGYVSTFDNIVVELDASMKNQILSSVKTITKTENGQQVTVDGSKENNALFTYENNNGQIQIRGNRELEIYYIMSDRQLSDQELEEQEWNKYNQQTGLYLEKNGTLYSRTKYKTGTYSEITSVTINNIDKLEPQVEVLNETANYEGDEVTLTIKVQDQEATVDYGKSGIYGYAITSQNIRPTNFIECTEGETTVSGITANGTYYIWVSDIAGNVKCIETEVTKILAEDQSISTLILSAPGHDELNGTVYFNITDAINALNNEGITVESGEVLIQLVRNIKNEAVIVENKNIKIDLNGYTLTSTLQEPTITVRSGFVTIDDNKYLISDYIENEDIQNKYMSSENTGKVYNPNFIAIDIEENGVLTLGENKSIGAFVEPPSEETPIVDGGLKAVVNNGVFNYYDGVIIGKTTLDGTVTDQPLLYSLATVKNSDGKYQATLKKVAGIEAILDGVRYSKLERAIEDANIKVGNQDEKVEIDIVNDIFRNQTIQIPENKNIVLDLNGYTINNSSNNYAIENLGKLEIIDSSATEGNSESGLGKITSASYVVLHNTGEFNLVSGSIKSTGMYYGILNEENGIVNILGGIVEASSNSSIYNTNSIVNVTGGSITGTNGIDNKNNGQINVEGGSIKGTTISGIINESGILKIGKEGISKNEDIVITGSGQGIYNISGGKMTLYAGTITATTHGIYSSGTVNVFDGIISGTTGITNSGNLEIENIQVNGRTQGINNTNSGNITIKKGTVTGTVYGINNESQGIINLLDATIEAFSDSDTSVYGVYNNSEGTIIFGEDDNNINLELPKISGISTIKNGKGYGIYNNNASSKINFYDGQIIGSLSSIQGSISNIPRGYTVSINASEEGEITTLKEKSKIAYVGENNENQYYDLSDAIRDCGEEGTITLIDSTTIVESDIMVIPENTKITLNLNGNTIKSSASTVIRNNGELILKDDIGTGNIDASNYAIDNFGKLDVQSGNLTSSKNYVIYNENNGLVDFNGGIIQTVTNSASYAGIYNLQGTVNIKGGTITSYRAVNNASTGTVVIDGGLLKDCYQAIYNTKEGNITVNNVQIENSANSGIHNNGKGTITIVGGIIAGKNYGIYNYDVGEIIIQGGEIIGNTTSTSSTYAGIYNRCGTISITDGKIQAARAINNSSNGSGKNIKIGTITIENVEFIDSKYGIHNTNSGKIVVKGGTIKGSTTGINNAGTALSEIEIHGGTIQGGATFDTYGIYNNAGSVTVCGGKISGYNAINNLTDATLTIIDGTIEGNNYGIQNASKNETVIESGNIIGNVYGINNESTGTVIIGQKDGNVSKELPYIKGNTCGFNNKSTGNIYFYDGVIKGKSGNSIKGTILDIENGYNVVKYGYGETQDYEIEEGMEVSVLEICSVALLESNGQEYLSLNEAIVNSTQTDKITLLINISISNDGDDIVIDSGKNITLDLSGNTLSKLTGITNNGTLTIEDSKGNGKIIGSTKAIQNNGTLNLNSETVEISGITDGICNSGNLIIENGIIKGSESAIRNEETGTVTIIGGTVEGTYSGVYNQKGIVNIENGKIQVTSTTKDTYAGICNIEGTVNISDGLIKGIYNTGNLLLNGGTVSDSKYGIYNLEAGKVIVENSSINGSSAGIYNVGTQNIDIKSGEVIGSIYGIYNESTGTINLGEKDGLIDTDILTIKGETYGIYNYYNGKINYYDGIIQGKIGNSINSSIYETEDGYNLKKYNYGETDQYNIDANMQVAVLEIFNVIYLESTNQEYASLKQAIENATNKDKIQLLDNYYVLDNESDLVIPLNKNITIDLAGYSLGKTTAITNNGTLELIDSVGDGKLFAITKAINNNGTFILNNAKIEGVSKSFLNQSINTSSDENRTFGIYNNETGIVNILEGDIFDCNYGVYNLGNATVENVTINSNLHAIYNNGILEVKNGTLAGNKGSGAGIYNMSGTATIYGGTLSGYRGIYNDRDGNVTVKDGIINNLDNSFGIYNYSNGTVTVENGKVSGKNYGINNNGVGIVNILGGEIQGPEKLQGTYAGIINNSTGQVNISGGTIKGCRGIYNNRTGKITITGGVITENSYGIYNKAAGTITIQSGTINSTEYAIYNMSTGTITLGNSEDGVPSTIDPSISAGTCSVYNPLGKLYFYDGIITGDKDLIIGTVTQIPENYKLSINNNRAILELVADFDNSIQVSGVYFQTLEAAVDYISNSSGKKGTITIWNDIVTNTSITIPEEVDITLELEGNQVEFSRIEIAITNNGTLRIVDFENIDDCSESTVSRLKNISGILVDNNGSVIIGKENNPNMESPRVEGTIAIRGNEPEVFSGTIVNTNDGEIPVDPEEPVEKISLFNLNKNSEKIATTVVSGIKKAFKEAIDSVKQLILSTEAEITVETNTEEWTNKSVKTTINSSVIGELNLYAEKSEVEYKIQYYYDDIKNPSEEVTEMGKLGSQITDIDMKEKTGYRLMTTEEGETLGIKDLVNGTVNLPLTILSDETQNIIKVYYIKDEFDYTVEYYYDGVQDEELTVTNKAKFERVIEDTDIEKKDKTGYKLDRIENVPFTITANPEENVIKVYYIKDRFDYTIEYYYEEINDERATVTQKAEFESVIEDSDIQRKDKTGYKFDRIEGAPLTISANPEENIIKVYYIKDSFDYTVEYYYAGVKDEELTVTGKAKFESVIEDSNIERKEKEGYVFDKIEEVPFTITANPEENVIKVYYEKDLFDYSIEYYYDGVQDEELTVTGKAKFETVIKESDIEDKVKIGYKRDRIETVPFTITANPEQNIIKVYYIKDSFDYTVEYYYAGEKDNNATVTQKAEFESVIEDSNVERKEKTGYKFDKIEGVPLTISANPEENIIKVYYVKDLFDYTIEYYYEGIKDNEATIKNKALFESIIEDTDIERKDKTGYKFDNIESIPLTISANPEENIIKVYYVKDKFDYTIEYYYEGVKDNELTVIKKAKFESIIEDTDIERKDKTGYKFDNIESIPLTISANPEENIIKVNYVKDLFDYTIEYYYEGIKDNEATIKDKAKFESIIEDQDIERKQKDGYKFDRIETVPFTITANPEKNIIKVYYIEYTEPLKEFDYKVEYYYDGQLDESKTDTITVVEGTRITEYTDKVITGYRLEKTENLPLIVDETEEDNIIKVYYVKDSFDYTVEYYYAGEKDEEATITGKAEFESIIDKSKVELKDKTGYRLMTTEEGEEQGIEGLVDGIVNLPLTISANSEENIIKVYYVKDSFKYTVEYYKYNEKDESATVEKTALYESQIQESDIENKVPTGYRLMTTEEGQEFGIEGLVNGYVNLPLTISANSEENVIRVYYVKDEFEYTVEYYYAEEKDEELTVTGKAEFESIINDTDIERKEKTGYKFDRIETVPFEITANSEENIIKVYYEKDEFEYTVEYYYAGEKDEEATVTRKAEFESIINDTDIERKEKTGYKFDRIETVPFEITANPEENIIKVYYVKDSFDYTIEYYYAGEKDEELTVTQKAEFESVIEDSNVERKDKAGYKFDSIEGVPLTISTNSEENIIKVYYVKDSFEYTVEYYYAGEKDEELTVTGRAEFESIINDADIERKDKTGYKFDRIEEVPFEITANPEENIIKVYYVKDSFDYTIEYYYAGEKDEELTVTQKAEFESVIDKSKVELKDKTGYRLMTTEEGAEEGIEDLVDGIVNIPLTITANSEENIIKVYYVKDSFEYTVEYYYAGEKDEELTVTGKAEFESIINDTDIERKDKIGYKFDRIEEVPFEITANPEENIIKVYYVKDSFDYTVEYYYAGEKDEELTVTKKAEFESIIEDTDIERKDKYLYEFDRIENIPLTISSNPEENIIKVYYVKEKFEYTVEYYYGDVKDEDATVRGRKEFESIINDADIERKDKTGYKFDRIENVPFEVTSNPEENIIKVYYVKDEFDYTIEYYYAGEKDEELTVTQKAEFESIIDKSKVELKDKTGYRLMTTEEGQEAGIEGLVDGIVNIPLTISANPEENVIKVYYVKDSFDYKVEYYYAGEKDDEKTITNKAEFESIIDKSKVELKDKTGYRLMTTEEGAEEGIEGLVDGIVNIPLTISANSEENIIKVYYVKDSFEYTVEYYYAGEKDEEATVVEKAKFESKIEKDTIDLKAKAGYRLMTTDEGAEEGIEGLVDGVVNLPLTISANTEENIIKVYYVINNDDTKELSYNIEYYLEGEEEVKDIETITRTVQVLQNTLPVKEGDIDKEKYVGYKFDKTDLEEIPERVEEGFVIKVYYVKEEYQYKVEYYYEGLEDNKLTKDEEQTVIGKEKYKNIIEKADIEDKVKAGYRLMKAEEGEALGIEGLVDGAVNLPLTISEKQEENVIKIYYVIKEAKVKVKYVDKATGEEILEAEEVTGKVFGKYDISEYEKEIEGYTLMEVPEEKTGEFTEEEQEKIYYYAKNTKVIVKYLEKDDTLENTTDNLVLAEEEIIEGYEGKEYTTKEKEVKGYTFVEATENVSGKMARETSEVVYYYAKNTKVIVNYLEKKTNKKLAEPEEYKGKAGDECKPEEKKIEQYELIEKPEKIIMTREEIVINYYYARVSEGVVERHMVKETNEILEEKTYTGTEGKAYKTTGKEFKGYELIKEEYPKNAEGTMTIEKIVVTYYYKKVEEPKVDNNKPQDNNQDKNKPQDNANQPQATVNKNTSTKSNNSNNQNANLATGRLPKAGNTILNSIVIVTLVGAMLNIIRIVIKRKNTNRGR